MEPPDDDPGQDPDQLPPHSSPPIFGSALSLIPQPLASAVARVAATHPLAFPVDDLNDFDLDLNWEGTDIDSLFLNETQYIQLGEHQTPPTAPPPPPQSPSSLDAATTTPPQHSTPHPHPSPASPFVSPPSNTAAAQTIPEAPLEPTTAFSQPQSPGPPHLAAPNDAPPRSRSRPSPPVQKRARTRLTQPPSTQSPIPIAPRATTKSNSLPDLRLKTVQSNPRSMQAQSSPLATLRSQSSPPAYSLDSSPASVSRETHLTQIPPNSVSHIPFTAPTPRVPTQNMYPLQHHQFMFQPSPPVMSPPDPNPPDSDALHPQSSSHPPQQKRLRLSEAHSPHSASLCTSQRQPHQQQPGTQQPFLSPPMQVMPHGILPYEGGIVPFFPMAFAAAPGKYPQGMIPTVQAGVPGIPSAFLNAFAPGGGHIVQNDNARVVGSVGDASARNRRGQQLLGQHTKHPDRPIVVQEGAKKVLVPQQTAARLERHPVLGRLQLKSSAVPQIATSAGLQSTFASETQNSPGDKHQRSVVDSVPGASSASKAGGPSSVGSHDGSHTQQKKRLVWTPELHERFIKAISAVGLSQAVPKTLVTIMNVEGLTTEHVKSHLQKYRNSLKKEAAEDERDRGRGHASGSSLGLHNLKLGSGSIGRASMMHPGAVMGPSGSGMNQSGVQNSGLSSEQEKGQGSPILPSRINAFRKSVGGMIEPTLQAQVSRTKGVKGSCNTATVGDETQREGEGHSPRPSVTSEIDTTEGVEVEIRSNNAAVQDDDEVKVGGRDVEADAMQVDAKGVEAKRSGSGSQKEVGILREETSKDREIVEEGGSRNQEKQDLEFEKIQQMQLEVQKMIFRTLAMEKQLGCSQGLQEEGGGTADASKQSAVGRGSDMQSGDTEGKGEGKVGETCTAEKSRVEKKNMGSAELTALKGVQRGLQKSLKDAAAAMLEKRMSQANDGDKTTIGKTCTRGEENMGQGQKNKTDSNSNRSSVDRTR